MWTRMLGILKSEHPLMLVAYALSAIACATFIITAIFYASTVIDAMQLLFYAIAFPFFILVTVEMLLFSYLPDSPQSDRVTYPFPRIAGMKKEVYPHKYLGQIPGDVIHQVFITAEKIEKIFDEKRRLIQVRKESKGKSSLENDLVNQINDLTDKIEALAKETDQLLLPHLEKIYEQMTNEAELKKQKEQNEIDAKVAKSLYESKNSLKEAS